MGDGLVVVRCELAAWGGDGVRFAEASALPRLCLFPNGMRLRFYCDDGDDLGRPDYLLFDGVIRQDAKGDWRATVVEDRYWHECGERPLCPA
jgi:hypothetical protein